MLDRNKSKEQKEVKAEDTKEIIPPPWNFNGVFHWSVNIIC
jgi:hypothetical protein